MDMKLILSLRFLKFKTLRAKFIWKIIRNKKSEWFFAQIIVPRIRVSALRSKLTIKKF